MALRHVFGCWAWDGDAGCILNSITGERLRFVGEDTPGSPWGGRPYLVRYEADDFQCEIAVSVSQEFPSNKTDVFWRGLRRSVQMVTLYQVNLGRTALMAGYRELPLGVWQRLTEFVPEAILFWPHAWPGVDDPADGPGYGEGTAARSVRVHGVWANGSWCQAYDLEFVFNWVPEIDPTAPLELLATEAGSLADLSSRPASPLVFVDERRAEEAATDRTVWPDPEGLKRWLAARGFSSALPEHPTIKAPQGLFDKVPHCRASDGSRYLFPISGVGAPGTHSPPPGPMFTLMTPDAIVRFRFNVLGYGHRRAKPNNSQRSEVSLFGLNERAGTEGRYISAERGKLTQAGRRLVWQNTLDAIAAWHPTQGAFPAERFRSEWEIEKDPGPSLVSWPEGDLEMTPLAWARIEPSRTLAGISNSPFHDRHFFINSWDNYLITD